LGECRSENALKSGEVGELRPHLVEMQQCNLSHFGAGSAGRFGEGKQGANVLNAESKLAGMQRLRSLAQTEGGGLRRLLLLWRRALPADSGVK